jgi:drug/metabolite transporter (DMT)-like permease
MGEAMGQQHRAEDMARAFERDLAQMARPGPKARAALYYPNGYTAGAGTLSDQVLSLTGFDNIGAEAGLTGGITPLTVAVNVLGALSISFGTVYQKRYATALNLAAGGAWQYVGATLVVLGFALATETFRFDGSFNAWFALAWSVLVLSLGAITLLMLLIREGGVARVSSLIFLVPGVSALMAYVLFGETLSLVQLIGMAVCAGAVLIVTRKALRPA